MGLYFVHDIIDETQWVGLSGLPGFCAWVVAPRRSHNAHRYTHTHTHTWKRGSCSSWKLRKGHGTDMTVVFFGIKDQAMFVGYCLENFELLLELETWFFRGVHLERPKVTLIIWLRSNQICRFLVVWTMKSQRVWMNLNVLPLTMLYFVLLCLIMLYKTICLSIGKKMESFMKLFKGR